MTTNELSKMKYQQPIVLSNELKISNRNNKTLILLPKNLMLTLFSTVH